MVWQLLDTAPAGAKASTKEQEGVPSQLQWPGVVRL
jgi:hypothetical protein